MPEKRVNDADLVRWSEALAGIARTGLAFTQSIYERERFEEVLKVAADIRVASGHDEPRHRCGSPDPVGANQKTAMRHRSAASDSLRELR